MKHNNVIPNGHFHKDWQNRIKTWFNQAAKKSTRRLKRKEKAAKCAPRPVGLLRPTVRCPTVRYASKVRLGRGFTLAELKEAGISPKSARSIGIAVDYRRINKSVESLQKNVQRLKAYKAKLIVVPGKINEKYCKDKEAATAKRDAALEQYKSAVQPKGDMIPFVRNTEMSIQKMKITEEMKNSSAFSTLRKARAEARLVGKLIKRAEDKKKN